MSTNNLAPSLRPFQLLYHSELSPRMHVLLDRSVPVSLNACCEGATWSAPRICLVGEGLASSIILRPSRADIHSRDTTHHHVAMLLSAKSLPPSWPLCHTLTLCSPSLLTVLNLVVCARQAQSNLLVTVCRGKTFIYLEPNGDDKVQVCRRVSCFHPFPFTAVPVAPCHVAKSTPTAWSSFIAFLECEISASSAIANCR